MYRTFKVLTYISKYIFFNLEVNLIKKKDNTVYLKLAGLFYKQLINDSPMVEKVCSSEVPHNIAVKLENKKNCMQNQCTAVLWIQYMGMVEAERTANWDLHLQAVYDMFHGAMLLLQVTTCMRNRPTYICR